MCHVEIKVTINVKKRKVWALARTTKEDPILKKRKQSKRNNFAACCSGIQL